MSELSARPLLSSALDAELFVARERQLEVLERSARERLNVLVLGEAGAGKTSLLHRFERRLDDEEALAPVFVEGARGAETAEELLTLVARRLGGSPDPFGRRPTTGTEAALVALADVRRALAGAQQRVVLILDELPNGALAATLFGRLRDELWSLPATWVVAAETADQAAYLRPPASAFFETVLTVGPLPDDAGVELLRRRIPDAGDERLRKIATAAGGNPRHLIAVARDVLLDGRDLREVTGARAEREERARAVGEAATRLVGYLEASGPASASDERLLAELGWSRSRATQVLRDLEQAGLVAPVREQSGSGRRKVYALS